ncbi:serine hydrolase [uncultured Roseibium sp.]|uniref:serine hydrolase n=1 Tax=uncultured Roseibium sp. TaxID=1936171 RepID=UPI0025944D57|nr:serine hydrolase [uncultured Roseibium sp.]
MFASFTRSHRRFADCHDLSRRFSKGIGLACALVLAGPAVTARAEEPTLSPAQTVSVPVDDAQIEAALEKLDALTQDVLERSGVPGLAVAVVWKGKTVFAQGYGVRAVGDPAPVDAETVFQIASLSKSLAATVVAGKVGEGVVRWDDPVVDHLPGFRLQNEAVSKMLTIGDLFAHRSGLPDHAGDDLEDIGFDRAQVLERLRLLPLGSFRNSYAYTNFGLTAAGEAVARASRSDWASLSDDVLYRPLGMSRTSSRFSDYMDRDNRALPHVRESGTFAKLHQRQPDAQSPAGGVSSSVNDMAKWMALVLGEGAFDGKQLIGNDALLQATTAQMISSPQHALDARPGFYGFGFNVGVEPTGRVTLSHSGAFALGAATGFLMVPSLDLGIVVLTNAEPFGVPEGLARSFMDVVEYGALTRDWLAGYEQLLAPLMKPVGTMAGKPAPVDPKAAGPLADYAGSYENAYFGPAKIVSGNDGLVLEIGPKGQTFDLTHWDGDTFVFEPRLENAPAGSRSLVRFERQNAEDAKSVWIEYFDEHGFGTFERP